MAKVACVVVGAGVLVALAGCEDPRGERWQEIRALEARVATLEQALDECRNGPDRLLRAARTAMEKGDHAAAIAEAKGLLAWHPRAPQAAEAQEIIRRATAVLADAEARQQADAERADREVAAARAKVLQQMVRKADDAQGVTYYRHRGAPDYLNARSVLAPYIVVDRAGRAYLLLRNVYVAKEMLMLGSVTVQADGKSFEFPDTFQRDRDDVAAWEWSEGAVSARQREMLAAVAQAKTAVIRYQGDSGAAARTLGAGEKAMIRDVLAAYDALVALP